MERIGLVLWFAGINWHSCKIRWNGILAKVWMKYRFCFFPVLDYGVSLRKGNQDWHFLQLQRVHILHHSVSSRASVIPVTLWRPAPGTCSLWDQVFVLLCHCVSAEVMEEKRNRAGALSTVSTLFFIVGVEAERRNIWNKTPVFSCHLMTFIILLSRLIALHKC